MSTTATLFGGPHDGDTRVVPDDCAGAALRCDPMSTMKPRFAVYIATVRGDLVFDSWAPSLDEGLSRLHKEPKA